MQDTKTRVRSYIFDNFIMAGDSSALQDSDSFMERHILDSTGFIELITFLEEAFAIKVEDDEMADCRLPISNGGPEQLRPADSPRPANDVLQASVNILQASSRNRGA